MSQPSYDARDLEIRDVELTVCTVPGLEVQYRDTVPSRKLNVTVVKVITNCGIDGALITWLPDGGSEIADSTAEYLRPLVVGQSVLDHERLWHKMMGLASFTASLKAISALDIALWDVAARAAGLPLYKFLGAYREEIRAYASTISYPEVGDYVKLAQECAEQGFRGFKIHAYGDPDRDLEVCRAVKDAVGDVMDLMHDPVNTYDYLDALRVGRELEEMGFLWYEAPIADDDILGYASLSRALDIPVMGGEHRHRLSEYPPYLIADAVDALRCVGDGIGGLTAMRKLGALCESFNRNLEPHSYGTTLVQAAHLHYMLSARNCMYFEAPAPLGLLDFGMLDVIRPDAAGMVRCSGKPGLGFDIDWDAIDNATIKKC